MLNKKTFYITTTLPYVNSDPHMGFALEIVQADAIARYKRLQGYEVFFNFGTDEHGLKIYRKANEQNKDPLTYVNEYAAKFNRLKKVLNLSYNSFIRTTDPHHKKAAQEIWKRCLNSGYIEKGIYKAKYCVGCELEKQDSDLENGKCPIHPSLSLELIEEENYFFKFSKFQKQLLTLYKKYPTFVIPDHRLREITNFVSDGLEDFSVSRLKDKMPWGVNVPGDDKHVMFVWFDALTSYISALGWPENKKNFSKFWGTKAKPKALQVAGKDNLRQQSAMWQTMLLGAGLPTTRQIFIHGFITSDGQKMSKSLGNVIDPLEYVDKYGTDALRYYLLAKINPTEDSDFTEEKFKQVYNADLANGLGNLISRVAKLCEKVNLEFTTSDITRDKRIDEALINYRFDIALAFIWGKLNKLDKEINETEPWNIKDDEKLADFLLKIVTEIYWIARNLQIFLPATSDKIIKQFYKTKIKSGKPLFPRI